MPGARVKFRRCGVCRCGRPARARSGVNVGGGMGGTRSSNGGHLEYPEAAIVSVYAFLTAYIPRRVRIATTLERQVLYRRRASLPLYLARSPRLPRTLRSTALSKL